MKVEFDISKCSNRFLSELATLIDSSEALKEIVDCAINIKHYNDGDKNFKVDEDFYLDEVVNNPHTPLESIFAIIEYPNATYARWSILLKEELDDVIIEHFAKFEKDFSLICIMIERHPITSQMANNIAERMIKNEVEMTNVINEDYKDKKVANENMELLIHKCSGKSKKQLKKWWSNKN